MEACSPSALEANKGYITRPVPREKNPGMAWEAEAGRSRSLRVQGQPSLHSKTLSQKKKRKKEEKKKERENTYREDSHIHIN